MNQNKMLGERVLIKPEIETTTAGGLIITDNNKERPMKGEVILVGCYEDNKPLTVLVGDTVLFGKYSGIEVKLPEGDFLIMKEEDIFMITNRK